MARPARKKKYSTISKRHALSTEELMFVRIYSAFGETNAAEAYRRAFLAKDDDGNYYLPDKKGDPRLDKPVDARGASKLATALLKQDHITGYLSELTGGAGDNARQVMSDAVLFTDDSTALKAAEKVLADEDKLGFRDAVELWAEMMCSVGGDVVFGPETAPNGGVVPLSSLFPQYAESAPPIEVIEKTIRTLEDMRDAKRAEEAALAAAGE